jgi:hypothetical protein
MIGLSGKLRAVGCFFLASVLFAASAPTPDRFTPQQRKYWAFQKVVRPSAPAIKNNAWARNPIDAFILAKLEAKSLAPAPPAAKATLLRRVSLDLTGLPPTPEETEAFLADKSPAAYEKVVDRLLASPAYGERWARHWLDLARYAESEGFKSDETRENAWRYRDYVIDSFNANKPYDRFVKEQIAGDELWPDSPEARLATAFLRHYPDESNARNLMQRRQEILDDITDTTAATFLGLTYGCARCHDHKFDPILQTDYYRLQAFFANTAADDEIPILPADSVAAYRERRARWEAETKSIREQMAAILEPRKQAMYKELFDKYPPEIQAAVNKPPVERTPYEWQMYYKAKPYLEFSDEAAADGLKGDAKKRYYELMEAMLNYKGLSPGPFPVGIGMHDVSGNAPPTYVLRTGLYDQPAGEVAPGFLSILDPTSAKLTPGTNTTGRRAALAAWLASPDNPLTARVMVNRLWHYHFGQGIAATPSDFGAMGQRPTHPELLDWLASEFVRSGWDIKAIHRLIVTSSTYRQSSQFNEASAKQDPHDRLLWHFPRQRLEAEAIRDSALAVSGTLNPGIGGPSVYPPLPDGMPVPRGGWGSAPDGQGNRRSIYIFIRRNARYPMLELFDMPDTHESCGRRNMTTTAPQALTLLNNKVGLEWAAAFADRVRREAGSEPARQIDRAWRLAYSRPPDAAEKDLAQTFLARANLTDLCHMLLNSNEFLYRD